MKVLIPSRRHYDNRLLKPYLATGLSFLIMQLVPYAEIGIDTLLAGTLVDISVVPALDVYNRLYTYVPALMSIALFPLWPVIAQAKRERDIAWIIKIKNRAYILVATTAVIIGLFFMVYGNSIVERWTSKQLVLPTVYDSEWSGCHWSTSCLVSDLPHCIIVSEIIGSDCLWIARYVCGTYLMLFLSLIDGRKNAGQSAVRGVSKMNSKKTPIKLYVDTPYWYARPKNTDGATHLL
uniref:Uncharacterized protein n=1 Tax=Rhizophagus irregularis (strain DAOM 181602 / DAOM 197198 / MUCL 43194) TaxID=747089 RepID=U9TN44_RHIID